MRTSVVSLAVLAGSALLLGGSARAADPPDSKVNPASGHIETVDATPVNGVFVVRHTIRPAGSLPPIVATFPGSNVDDGGARLAIAEGGDAWVVWWRARTPAEIHVRQHGFGSGTWGPDEVVSTAGEDSRFPRVVRHGDRTFIVYEIAVPGGRSVAVLGADGTGPWPTRSILHTTTSTALLDLTIDSAAGNLWVTWIEGPGLAGWSEYDGATDRWGTPGFEPFGPEGPEPARGMIRATVLGN